MKRWTVLSAILGTLLAFGCAHRAPPPQAVPPPKISEPPASKPKVSELPVAKPKPPEPPVVKPPVPEPSISPADRDHAAGLAEIAENRYEGGLEMFAAAWKESPGHPGVARDFPEALISLKKSGDEAVKQGRLEDAGKRWEATNRYMSHPAGKGRPLPFTKTELRGSIDRLSASLMEKGLVEYRKGNLEAAIAIWRSILAYDPTHAEATRSVQTASTQLENLKKIAPPK